MEKVIGIEVKGELYRIEDEETSGKTQTLETKVATAEINITNLETATTKQAEKVAKIETNIGETDISELSETVEGHSDELTEISEELPKIKADIDSVLFGKLEVIKEPEGSDEYIGKGVDSDFSFNIQDWAKYKGVVLVTDHAWDGTNILANEKANLRIPYTFLKKKDNTLKAMITSLNTGERQVTARHILTVDPLGRAVLQKGYQPKEDSESESSYGQYIFPIYIIYGIL